MRQLIRITVFVIGVLALFSTSAYAQATRTWVSGVGDDANPCSRTAPCKTFAGSISKTAPGGEINVLDPGGFGALTITKSITIRADHVESGVLVSGTNGIVVSVASTDKVVLQGLDFDGIGTGLSGISMTSAGTLTIDRCDIRNFVQNGINVAGPSGTRVYVTNSRILNNGGSTTFGGIFVSGSGNGVFVTDSLVDNNVNFALQSTNSASVIILNNQFTRSTAAISYGAGVAGTVTSYGGNLLHGTGAPTSTSSLQ